MIDTQYINQESMRGTQENWAYKGWCLFGLVAFLLCISIMSATQFENALAWSVGLLYVTYDTWLICYVSWKTAKLKTKDRKVVHEKCSKIIASDLEPHSNTTLNLGVLVPVYNESTGIIKTIDCLLKQTEMPKQIIIVNDGSTDYTRNKLAIAYGFKCEKSHSHAHDTNNHAVSTLYASEHFPNLFLFDKKNSGKADSLNQVMQHIDCDIVVTVDADTLLETDAITEAYQAFEKDNTLVAACGVLKPVTRGGWGARMFGLFQYFEYLRAYLSRAAWAQSNALLLVSGAFSVYRRSALIDVGGYDDTSLVEDYELIHRMHKYSCDNGLNWRIDVLENARATTDAPTTVLAFVNQRKRWFAGFLRTHYKYRNMIASAKYKDVGQFMLPIKTIDTLQPIFGIVALFLLWRFLITDHDVSTIILMVIGVKLVIDYCFHIWSLYKYHRWLGQPAPRHLWVQATFCCLADPFIFQPLRHLSACIGWTLILQKNARWEPIRTQQNNNIPNF
jgi:cellulose synthase/poly-beta-1,6-N-acetylglucosamine synthase-like glycosyltransferase